MKTMKATMTPRQELIRELERVVRRGEEARVAFVADLTDVEKTLYAIRWISDLPRVLHQAKIAQDCLAYLNDNPEKSAKAAVAILLDEARQQRASWYPEHSTSPWSNAVNDERYEALQRFQETLESLQHWFTSNE